MNASDLLGFLLPHDGFQWFFLTVILTAGFGNAIAVWVRAKSHYWEKRWRERNTGSNTEPYNLGSDHGSVNDLSHAVATTPEKLAEIMPGILLVFGLLGTFVGLGLALNKASLILQNAQSAGMDTAMANLMSMMEGLGTKFKTSTWGIIGFLVFKAWAIANGYEERRLQWVVGEFENDFKKRRKELDSLQNQIIKRDDDRNARLVNAITVLKNDLHDIMNANTSMLGNSMINFTKSAETMGNAAIKISEAATGLSGATTDFGSKVESVLDKVKDDLNDAITNMQKNLSSVLGELGKQTRDLSASSQSIATAVESMSGKVEKTLTTVGETISQAVVDLNKQLARAEANQNEMLSLFYKSSNALSENAEKSTNITKALLVDLNENLASASEARRELKRMLDPFVDAVKTFDALRIDLKALVDETKASVGQVGRAIPGLMLAADRSGKFTKEFHSEWHKYMHENRPSHILLDIKTNLEDINSKITTRPTIVSGLATVDA